MSLILFTAPTPDGYKISIALEELGLAYEVHPLDLTGGEQKRPDFLKLNPNGKVPCLVDDGFAIMESGAILLWLAEKAGHLLPTDRHARSERRSPARSYCCHFRRACTVTTWGSR